MKWLKRLLCTVCCVAIGLGASFAAAEDKTYANPLLNPDTLTGYAALPDRTINVLLLGIDYGHKGYWGSGWKKNLDDCHTDAVMVAAVHPDTQKVDLVSLPRDTLTYVPGVRGIYKLNGAINCGDTLEDGLRRACDAASWVLGGIGIDYYCAVDMNVMEELGDAMGGVDFDLEMTYTGHSGTRYYKGLRHLDGTGIMDYFRSRTNATVNSNDIGRTNRQRALIIAIYEKLRENPDLIREVLKTALANADDFFTNIQLTDADALSALPFLLKLDEEDIGSYVITGKYRTALKGWNFTFTDQDNRRAVIQKVYGIDATPLAYVDYAYTKWLVDSGFRTIHMLTVAESLKTYLTGLDESGLAPEEQTLITDFLTAYTDTRDAFQTASDSTGTKDTNALYAAGKAMRKAGDAAAKALGYPDDLPWHTGKYWYADPYVNQAIFDWQ